MRPGYRRPDAGRLTAAALVVLLMAGCSSTPSEPAPATTSVPGPSTPADTTPSSPEQPPPPQPTTLTLAFAGDLNFDQQLAALLDGPRGRLAAALRPLLGGADLAMLNLETAITERGEPEPKTYHFRASASALDVVASTGVDVVTMANNHAADYGPLGLADTLAAKRRSPIPIVGIGTNAAEAFAPVVLHRLGLSIAFFGSTEIDDLTLNKFAATDTAPGVATNLDPDQLLAAVRKAAAAYDLVVVYLHWGLDYTSCPDGIQPAMASRLSAAGADIIVGSHAHRVLGGGWLGDSYVDYGLGNFVWARNDGANGVSGVLTLTVDVPALVARRDHGAGGRRTGRSVVATANWTPLLIDDDGIPRKAAKATREDLAAQWEQVRLCTNLSGIRGD